MTIALDDPEALERSVEKTRQWIDDTAAELGTEDRVAAYTTLKAVLHAVRDGISVDEAARLAAELPDRLRWAFYEGWCPSRVPVTYHDRDEFLGRVASEVGPAGATEASYAVASVGAVLARHVSEREVDDVFGALPGQVRCLLELKARRPALSRPARSRGRSPSSRARTSRTPAARERTWAS